MTRRRSILLGALLVVLVGAVGAAWFVSPGRMLGNPSLPLVLNAAIRGVPGIVGTDSVVFDRRELRPSLRLWPFGGGDWPLAMIDSVVASKLVVAEEPPAQPSCPASSVACPVGRHITVAVSVPMIVGKFATLEAVSSAREADGAIAYVKYAFLLHRGGNGWHVVRQRIVGTTT